MPAQTQEKTGLFLPVRRVVGDKLRSLIEPYSEKAPAKPTPRKFDIYNAFGQGQYRQGLTGSGGNPEQMMKAFTSIVFSCINVRAMEVANRAKFLVKVVKAANEYEVAPVDHPLVELLANPNPTMAPYHFWYNTIAHLDLTGNSYWWVGRDSLGIPRSLWPIVPYAIKIIPGNPAVDGRFINGYEICWDGRTKKSVDAVDIVHLRHPDPTNPYYYGGSLVMKAAYEIDIARYMLQYQRDYFANDATPGLIVDFKHEMSDTVRTAFEENWIKRFRGNPGRVAYLEGEATIEKLQDEGEMNYKDSWPANARRVCSTFRMPASKIMDTESVLAQATRDQVEYAFQKDCVDPLLTLLHQQLTLDLALPFFGDKVIVDHASTIPQDMKLQAELDNFRVDKIVPVNEIRKRDGLDPVDGGDTLFRKLTDVPISEIGIASAEPPPPPDKGAKQKALSAKDLTEAMKGRIWKAHGRVQLRYELRLTKKLKAYFREIEADSLTRINKLLEKDAGEDEAATRRYMFDVGEWQLELQKLLSKEALAIFEAAFEDFVKQYSIEGVIFEPSSIGVREGLAAINAKTVTVPKTLHDELQKEILEGVRLKETAPELAARVSKFFDRTIDYRSMRIARTVSNYAVNQSNSIAAKDSGLFDAKVWITRRDDRVRGNPDGKYPDAEPSHWEKDGISVGIGDKFKFENGDALDVPGDPNGSPANIIFCRCTVFFVRAKS